MPRFYGELRSIEDFVVKEILSEKFMRRFMRTKKGIERMHGNYALYLLKKKNLSTTDAIERICKTLGIEKTLIGLAGLKDKNALTYQYITLRYKEKKEIKTKNLELKFIRFVNRRMNIGELLGNEFFITLHNCKYLKRLPGVIEMLRKKGMPNFFGPQRFGRKAKNWKRGKRILILKHYTNKEQAKFLIQAYQSYLFNKALSEYIKRYRRPLYKEVVLPGFKSRLDNSRFSKILKQIMKEESITFNDFRIDGLTCIGDTRKAFIKPKIEYEIRKNSVKLHFVLPPGSYATVLLYEICDYADYRDEKMLITP